VSAIQPGDIFIADVLDPQGKPCGHRRPVMLLRAATSSENVWGVAISTTFADPLPDHWLPLPSSKGGHPVTGLKELSVLKCDWTVSISKTELGQKIGIVPTDIFNKAVDSIIALLESKRRGQA
jgi:mRNA-degrading endonuclease toxin of MazEF toxin-antitoxin module